METRTNKQWAICLYFPIIKVVSFIEKKHDYEL